MYSLNPISRNHIKKVKVLEYKKVVAYIILFFLAFNTNFSAKIFAQGNLLIIPKRVVFEGAKKTHELNLANIGRDTAIYQVSFVQIRMHPDGKFENITAPDSGQLFADPYIRYYPRKVILAPNEAQTLKLQLTKSSTLQQGEYRSHLYFRAIPKDPGLLGASEEAPPAKDSNIAVKLVPVFGITIPIIVQVGNLTADVKLSGLSLQVNKDTVHSLQITFNRSGSRSVYGDITVDYISPAGKEIRVGLVKGIAVYNPTITRHFVLQLDKKEGVDYSLGKLNIVYADQSPKPIELAKAELVLQ
ncbi:MAG: molecular chaperone [Chitinophagaceae bacterium]|nr:molecular chaperone [Chitinophagaceae bacterium]